MKISLILPVYNPPAGWAATVLSYSAQLRAMYADTDFEIIVVNDGSTNSYIQEKKILPIGKVHLMEYEINKGKGEALRTGVSSATGDIYIYTDIDFPYTLHSMGMMIDLLTPGDNDIVVGVKDTSYYEHVPPIRRFVSRLLRLLIRTFIRIPTDDTQCGLKGFNTKGKEIFLQTTISRYLFDLEFVFLASRQKNIAIKIQEIELREDIKFSKMNFGIARSEMWNFLKILMKR